MTATPDRWSKAYRPLRPRSLAIQLLLLVVAEVALYASYDVHDARFHWATHFLVALAFASLVLLVRLLVTGAPGPRLLLPSVLGFHLFAMAPDIAFRAGLPHYPWMNAFLGHIAAHELPGGDGTWLVIALVCVGLFVAALTAWLRARHAEAAAGMPPGIGLTGMAVLRPQVDPRGATLVHDENGPAAGGPTVVLLHGLGASSAFWRPVAARLNDEGNRTLVPDLLGFGASIRLGTHFHLDDQAAAVVRLVERHGGGPVVLAAHSYGAAVAVRVAIDRPDLVRRLVLVAPAAFADAAQARERIGGRSWIARKTMSGSPVAGVACGTMCLLRRPLTSLAPRVAARVSPDIPPDVARDAVRYVWPAYRDALTSRPAGARRRREGADGPGARRRRQGPDGRAGRPGRGSDGRGPVVHRLPARPRLAPHPRRPRRAGPARPRRRTLPVPRAALGRAALANPPQQRHPRRYRPGRPRGGPAHRGRPRPARPTGNRRRAWPPEPRDEHAPETDRAASPTPTAGEAA